MTRVLYTGAFRFPDLDAAAFRVAAVADLFEQAGCSVAFAGWERQGAHGAHYRHRHRDCYPQAEFREGPRSRVGRLLGFLLRGARTLRWLSRHRDFDVVVAYNPPALFSLALLFLGRRWRMRVALDSTEWYEGEHLPGGRYGPAAIENWVRMRLVYPMFRNVICISRLLEEHFAGRNLVYVPPLVAIPAAVAVRPSLNEGVFFLYAGDAGKKDRLLSFVRSIPALQVALKVPVTLRIAGLDRDAFGALLRSAGMAEAAHDSNIECLGRISREAVMRLYAVSHFSVLFREDRRYARAGFPTKAAESWSSGCPIVANPVGDVGTLASHMVDSILIREEDIAARLPDSLKALMVDDSYPRMAAASRALAGRLFAPENYRLSFERFVRRLESGPGLPA